MAKGIIYIMTTAIDGLVKIGRTETKRFNSRMTELEMHGYRNVTGLKRFFAIEVDDYLKKELLLHDIFSKSRISDTELFALNKDIVKELLDAFEGTQVYPAVTIPLPVAPVKPASTKTHKTNLTFEMIGIPKGAELIFRDDPSIIVITEDEKNKVKYKGNIYTISKVVSVIKENALPYQGGLYFKYEGELLTDRRARFEKIGKL